MAVERLTKQLTPVLFFSLDHRTLRNKLNGVSDERPKQEKGDEISFLQNLACCLADPNKNNVAAVLKLLLLVFSKLLSPELDLFTWEALASLLRTNEFLATLQDSKQQIPSLAAQVVLVFLERTDRFVLLADSLFAVLANTKAKLTVLRVLTQSISVLEKDTQTLVPKLPTLLVCCLDKNNSVRAAGEFLLKKLAAAEVFKAPLLALLQSVKKEKDRVRLEKAIGVATKPPLRKASVKQLMSPVVSKKTKTNEGKVSQPLQLDSDVSFDAGPSTALVESLSLVELEAGKKLFEELDSSFSLELDRNNASVHSEELLREVERQLSAAQSGSAGLQANFDAPNEELVARKFTVFSELLDALCSALLPSSSGWDLTVEKVVFESLADLRDLNTILLFEKLKDIKQFLRRSGLEFQTRLFVNTANKLLVDNLLLLLAALLVLVVDVQKKAASLAESHAVSKPFNKELESLLLDVLFCLFFETSDLSVAANLCAAVDHTFLWFALSLSSEDVAGSVLERLVSLLPPHKRTSLPTEVVSSALLFVKSFAPFAKTPAVATLFALLSTATLLQVFADVRPDCETTLVLLEHFYTNSLGNNFVDGSKALSFALFKNVLGVFCTVFCDHYKELVNRTYASTPFHELVLAKASRVVKNKNVALKRARELMALVSRKEAVAENLCKLYELRRSCPVLKDAEVAAGFDDAFVAFVARSTARFKQLDADKKQNELDEYRFASVAATPVKLRREEADEGLAANLRKFNIYK